MDIDMDISVDSVDKDILEENRESVRINEDTVDIREGKDENDKRNLRETIGSKENVADFKKYVKIDDEKELWRRNVDKNGWKDKNGDGREEFKEDVKEDSENKHSSRGNDDENEWKTTYINEEGGYVENLKESDYRYSSKSYSNKHGWRNKRGNKDKHFFKTSERSIRESNTQEERCKDDVGSGKKSFIMSWPMRSRGVHVPPDDVGAPVICGELQFGVVQSSFVRNGTLVVVATQVVFDISNVIFNVI